MTTRELRISDNLRNFSWVQQQLDSKNLRIGGALATEKLFDEFRLFIKNTQEIHPNMWDLEGSVQTLGTISITGVIIYYPEIVISNSHGVTHTITDLYIRISLHASSTSLQIGGLEGGRMSSTYKEHASNYFHSHLSGGGASRSSSVAPFFGNFCRGSGHINDHIANINGDGMKEENIIPFLIQLTGFISWESLEGGPHKRILDMRIDSGAGRRSNPSMSTINWTLDNARKKHQEKGIVPDLDFKMEGDRYVLENNEKFEKFLTENVDLPIERKREIMCMRDSRGNLYQYGNIPGYPSVGPFTGPNEKFIFQGVEKTYTVGPPPDAGDTSEIVYFLNPKVTTDLKIKIEHDINSKKVRESTIRRYSNKVGHSRESVESDKVAV